MLRCLVLGTSDTKLIKPIKSFLESKNSLNKSIKIANCKGIYHIYSTLTAIEDLKDLGIPHDSLVLDYYEMNSNDKSTLKLVVEEYLRRCKVGAEGVDIDQLLAKLPRKWTVYSPMVLFNSDTFDSEMWQGILDSRVDRQDFFGCLLSSGVFPCNLTHIAINRPIIEEDVMRRPFNLIPLYGDFGPEPTNRMFSTPTLDDFDNAFWCSVVQNGIYQTWAPKYTMFSRGNIKEKKRILDNFVDLDGKSVIDLYAGIGYFTLSYLKNGATLFCWELNPWSVQGLIMGVEKNKYKYRVTKKGEQFDNDTYNKCISDGVKVFIFEESNEYAIDRLSTIQSKLSISHINLGILPSSKASWNIAKELVNDYSIEQSAQIHIHENVHIDSFENIKKVAMDYFENCQISHLEKVKTFAPDIWHIVIDLILHNV